MSGHALWSDRAAGVVLGGAAGDALGAGYEFGPALGPEAVVAPRGGGAFGWAPGEWTDDTQMASAILSSLSTGVEGEPAVIEIAAGFIAWFASNPPDVGNQTRRALGRAGGDPAGLAAAALAEQEAHPDAAGNGSLMRTGPVGLAPGQTRLELAQLVAAISDLTHPHPDCASACVLWCEGIRRFEDLPPGAPNTGWVEHLRSGLDLLDGPQRIRWGGLLDTVAGAEPDEFAPRNGWVVDAFRQAVAALEATPIPAGRWGSLHLRRVLDRVVRGGGDTDTVAAIAGSLAGAAWGATAVPLDWQVLLHGIGARPGGVVPLTGADLSRQARLAIGGGRPDPQGWPSGASMLPFYNNNFSAPPLARAFDDVLSVGNVHALATVDVDLVVSLCRVGSEDVPPGAVLIQVGLLDDPDPRANPNLVPLLGDIAKVVDGATTAGKRVFLHCVRAEHRTPAALAAVLVRRGLPPDQAVIEAEAATGGEVLTVFRDALIELANAADRGATW